MTGLLIAIFLGWAGGYRFYKKQPVWGVIYLFTFGIAWLGWIVDIVIALNEYMKSRHTAPVPAAVSEPEIRNEMPVSTSPTFWLHSSKDTDKNIGQIHSKFIVVDTETTGVNPDYDRMVSLAAVIYENGQPVRTFNTLVNQPVHIPAEATSVNGITDNMIKTAPSEHDVCKSFLEFCGDAVFAKTLFVAYNSSFDFKIIKLAMERYGFAANVRHFDVLAYARKKLSGLDNYKQGTVADYLGIDSSGAHDALTDCKMCAAILLKLVDM